MYQPVGKTIMAFVMLTSLFFLGMEIVGTWQSLAHVKVPPLTKEKRKSRPRQRLQKVSFYPSVPSPIPDLRDGYLFNEQRHLADPEKKEDKEISEKGIEVDLDKVMYTGSIMIGDMIKGLISYPEPMRTKIKSRRSRSKSRKKRKLPRGTKQMSKIVQPGDVIGGFRVSGIAPEKIIFSREDERVEKMLHDPKKKRIVVPKNFPRPKKTKKRITSTSRRSVKRRKVARSRSTNR